MSEAAAHIAKPGVAIRGLYAVTPDESDTGVLAAKVSAALNGGAKLVQYRNKTADQRKRREQALGLLTVCRTRGVPLIIIKPAAVTPPLQLLQEAQAALSVPVAAIGGITAANTAQLIAAGAASVAVISALFAASDAEAAAREIAAHFSPSR
jgi:thiamine monophosphate synthase